MMVVKKILTIMMKVDKMKKEINLSEKIRTDGSYQDIHVKEAVRLLKEEIRYSNLNPLDKDEIYDWIDKIFGEKLI